MLLSAQNGFSKDLTAYTVGDILTVSDHNLAATAIVGLVALTLVGGMAGELTFSAFDLAGYRAAAVDFAVLALVEAAVVIAVPTVRTILAVSLLMAPAATARLWGDRIPVMTAVAVLIGAGSGAAGVALSTQVNIAAGGAIAVLSGAVFTVSFLLAPRRGLVSPRLVSLARSRG